MGSNPTQGSFFFEKRKSCPGCIYLPCFVYHVQQLHTCTMYIYMYIMYYIPLLVILVPGTCMPDYLFLWRSLPSVPSSPTEKLSDCLKLQRHPAVSSEVFLSFRTLLLKFSSTHLMSFWPAIVAETVRIFTYTYIVHVSMLYFYPLLTCRCSEW